MRLTHLTVSNYRGLRDVAMPLSRFSCCIGKNNAGKSTVLQAIALFFSGTKLSSKDYFAPADPIRIEIRFEDIDENDLSRLAAEHREKIEPIIVGRAITLVRRYDTTGNSRLQYVTMLPKDKRFHAESVTGLLKGLTGKEVTKAVVRAFPELEGKLAGTLTQAKAKEEIRSLAQELPIEEKELSDCDLPTGIDASIKGLLPDPIYIPAVKNLADDVKAKESTPFGKVLSILMDAIEPQLGDVKKFFGELSKKFNRVTQDDGAVTDERLPEVQLIEKTVEKYLRESFSNVSLEINVPPPELKAILSSAELLINDGVKGGIESKGDGLRRAAVFAILRSYVALNEPGAMGGQANHNTVDRHILLFEEPELYLHPSAQKVLFDALSIFSRKNHVVITTHSPSFFGPTGTASFVKLQKTLNQDVSTTPYTTVHPVDLTGVEAKDQFQLICFENNNAAFFFDSVVLVEGDSDYIVLPHIASLITPGWEALSSYHRFVRISGKGSIKRYKEFFKKFNVRVSVVTDLDLLTGGFELIEASRELQDCRSKLLELVDKEIEATGGFEEPKSRKVREAQEKTELLGRWKTAKQVWKDVCAGKSEMNHLVDAVDAFFAWEKRSPRLAALQKSTNKEILDAKRLLLSKLRLQDVYVLERGALEEYYPANIDGRDKPSMAQDFCRKITSREEVLALCEDHCDDGGKPIGKEFEIICSGIFKRPFEEISV